MNTQVAKPVRRLLLDLTHSDAAAASSDGPVRDDLSVVAQSGRCLWTASDETTTLERLVTTDWESFGEHRPFRLGDFFDLPAGPDQESDIEGIGIDGSWLWVTGSHSLKRKKPGQDERSDPDALLERLARIECEPNRYLLGRIPLVPEEREGVFTLARTAPDPNGGKPRTAACLKTKGGSNALTSALRRDVHLAPFLNVPAKENGFDIEGLAAHGDKLFLGLRGPVLRGWAVILELSVKVTKSGDLKLRRIGDDGERYFKHFLDLDGLGIRELCFHGEDLLILAGPTMDLDGPVVLYRWRGALTASDDSLVPAERMERMFTVPHGAGFDHAEGMTVLNAPDRPPALLVIYDSPGADRRRGGSGAVEADLFAFPSPSGEPSPT